MKTKEIKFRFEGGKEQCIVMDAKKNIQDYFQKLQRVTNQKIYVKV